MNINKITSSWTFTYIAIYGAVAFLTATFALIGQDLNMHFTEIPEAFIAVSTCLNGGISIISAVVFLLFQVGKPSKNYILISIFLLIFAYAAHPLIHLGPQGGAYYALYLIVGIPITLILFVIPLIGMFLLEVLKKLPPPKNIIKNKKLALTCFLYLITLFITSLIVFFN